MTDGKLVAAGLFSVAVALVAIAWTIHDHADTHQRYQLEPRGLVLDTSTGEVSACRSTQTEDSEGRYQFVDGAGKPAPPGDCQTIISARREK